METINMIKPTSKANLKQACLFLANLDVDKASKMYDFLIKDMEELPTLEAAAQPFLKNFGEQANGVFNWLRENKDVLSDGVNFIRGIIQKKAPAAEPLPPINP